uniref:Putative ovule protein n=1 Tax=Solanum chacoense TaxID=4108 RepID=A0A0V0GWN8_SOLCH
MSLFCFWQYFSFNLPGDRFKNTRLNSIFVHFIYILQDSKVFFMFLNSISSQKLTNKLKRREYFAE